MNNKLKILIPNKLEVAPQQAAQPIGGENDEEVDEEEMMRRMFGFSGFSSTKVFFRVENNY